jgi:hypothetical protein
MRVRALVPGCGDLELPSETRVDGVWLKSQVCLDLLILVGEQGASIIELPVPVPVVVAVCL